MKISHIVAVARNGVIGNENKLPWNIPGELARFKALTLNHVVIMGRNTYLSLPKTLVDRRMIVISKTLKHLEDAQVYGSLQDALNAVSMESEVFIMGGGMLYRESMLLTQTIYLTWVELNPEGDVTYPVEGLKDFVNVETIPVDGPIKYSYHTYERL